MCNRPVVVVGCSAAGLYVASLLAESGIAVHVYEGFESLDPPSRTLIVTEKLRHQIGELADRCVVNEVRTFALFSNGDRATVQLERPDLIIERATLIRALAERATVAGARIFTGHRLVGLERAGMPQGSAAVKAKRGRPAGAIHLFFDVRGDNARTHTVEADVVVGADGTFSSVARFAGWPEQPTVPLVQAIVEPPADMPPNSVRVWFAPEDTPYFYWLIPESSQKGVLGIIGDESPAGRNPREALEGFLAKEGLRAREFQAGKIPLYVKWIPVHRAIGGGDVYLVGDAAGQVKVTTVGGIVTGFRGARGVVDALLKRNGNGASPGDVPFALDDRTGRFRARTNGEIRALRRELNLHLSIRRAMHGFKDDDYGRLLGLLTDSAKFQLGRFHRDETWRLMANLLLRQPRLLTLGLRKLIAARCFGPSRFPFVRA